MLSPQLEPAAPRFHCSVFVVLQPNTKTRCPPSLEHMPFQPLVVPQSKYHDSTHAVCPMECLPTTCLHNSSSYLARVLPLLDVSLKAHATTLQRLEDLAICLESLRFQRQVQRTHRHIDIHLEYKLNETTYWHWRGSHCPSAPAVRHVQTCSNIPGMKHAYPCAAELVRTMICFACVVV